MNDLKENLKTLVRKVAGLDVYRAPTRKITVSELKQFSYLERLFEKIAHMEGDVVECGVGKGGTFLFLSHLASISKKARAVWGFDSFEGFPEPSKEDESERNPQKGEWAGTSPSDIFAILKNAYVPERFVKDAVHLVPGFVENTLEKYSGDSIAFLHVDLDLYEAYKVTLMELYPKMPKGGVILFDEYGEKNWPGATQAVDEFLKRESQTLEKDEASGKHYVIKA